VIPDVPRLPELLARALAEAEVQADPRSVMASMRMADRQVMSALERRHLSRDPPAAAAKWHRRSYRGHPAAAVATRTRVP
jgi:hypothetical protein